MGTLSEKLNHTAKCKESIRQAVNQNLGGGAELISPSTQFDQYANYIDIPYTKCKVMLCQSGMLRYSGDVDRDTYINHERSLFCVGHTSGSKWDEDTLNYLQQKKYNRICVFNYSPNEEPVVDGSWQSDSYNKTYLAHYYYVSLMADITKSGIVNRNQCIYYYNGTTISYKQYRNIDFGFSVPNDIQIYDNRIDFNISNTSESTFKDWRFLPDLVFYVVLLLEEEYY